MRCAVPTSFVRPPAPRCGAGAVLARHLAHARVDAEAAQCAGQQLGQCREAVLHAGHGVRVGDREVEHDGRRVIGGGMPAGRAQHRLEAVRAGGARGVREAGPQRVQPPERDRRGRAVQAQRRRRLAAADPLEQRMRGRDVERAAPRPRVADQREPRPVGATRRHRPP